MSIQKLDLENIFIEANVKPGEEFYSSDYGWVIYDGISRYMGTTLLDFKCKIDTSKTVSYRCDGTLYYIEGHYTQITIHPDSVKTGWFNWLNKRVKNNTTTEKNMVDIDKFISKIPEFAKQQKYISKIDSLLKLQDIDVVTDMLITYTPKNPWRSDEVNQIRISKFELPQELIKEIFESANQKMIEYKKKLENEVKDILLK